MGPIFSLFTFLLHVLLPSPVLFTFSFFFLLFLCSSPSEFLFSVPLPSSSLLLKQGTLQQARSRRCREWWKVAKGDDQRCGTAVAPAAEGGVKRRHTFRGSGGEHGVDGSWSQRPKQQRSDAAGGVRAATGEMRLRRQHQLLATAVHSDSGMARAIGDGRGRARLATEERGHRTA